MSEYIVSARKYRPVTFDSVVGQGAIATTLKNAIRSGKLAHAYLFCGPRGVGKTTCARIFAKTINCTNLSPDGEACGQCESCQAFQDGRSLNIHELDAASNNSVDDIRALIDQVRIPPQIGRYKVFIIDEVHMLSTSAFNAFLKTLEEPPSHAIFILATTEKHKILPTILSRCQIYDFQRMSVEQTVQHLAHVASQEGYTAEPAALNVIAQKADGGMRDALSIFDQAASFTDGNITYQSVIENLGILDYDYYFRIVDLMLEQKVPDCLLLLNEVLGKGFDGGVFINGLASHLRDVLVCRDVQTAQLLEAADEIRQRYIAQSQRCKVQWLYRAIRLCNDCDQSYRTSRNKRLQVELCLIECAQAVSDDDPSAGRRPIRFLKPLFAQLAAAAAATVAPQPSSAPAQPSCAEPLSSYATTVPKRPASPVAQPSPTQPRSTTPSPVAQAGSHHSFRIGSLSPSIRRTSASPSKAEPGDTAPAPSITTATSVESQPITAAELQLQWHNFINTMPREETALAQRMRAMQPTISAEAPTTITITVENDEVRTMMQQLSQRLLPTLRQSLHNDQLVIDYVVAEHDAPTRIYDKREQLRHLCDLNPSLISLGKAFKLEII